MHSGQSARRRPHESASGRARPLVAALVLVAAVLLTAVGILRSSPAAVAAGDPVIAAAGDIACDPTSANFNGGNGTNGSCQQKATWTVLNQINPVAVLPLGDNQYYCGGYQAFVSSYGLSWGQLLSKTYPVVGNHEYLTSGGTGCDSSNANAAGYFRYFAAAAKVGTTGQGWYSFDVGRWHLIAINSNCGNVGGCGTTSAQGSWLASDLAAHKNQCLLAYWHIPLWSSGGRASRNTSSIVQQLYNARADVILNGHDHIYERFAPQNAAGQADPTNGIREFIVGTGGANHTSLATPAANSQIRNASAFGVLQLTLHSGSYDWSFVSAAGGSFADSGTQTCHSSGGGGLLPSAPVLSLSSSDANDFVSGSTVFYRQGASGGFTVGATSTGASSAQFPVVFGSDGVNDTSTPFSKTYSWGSSANSSGSFGVTGSNTNGASTPSQFTVTPDALAPSTSSLCNGGSCVASFSSSVTVSLSGSDTGSGLRAIYYTTDGSTPTTSSNVYSSPLLISATTTVRYFAVDNVGNAEAPKSVTVTIGSGAGGGGVSLVQQKTGSGSTASLPVTLNAPSGARDALVAVVALAAGSSASVLSMTDSAGGTWTKGPVGFLTGVNSRVEIWYRLDAPSVSGVTVMLSASKAVAVDVSEWSGVASASLDGSAGDSGASSTTASTRLLATSNETDLVIGAVNYPAVATSTLASGSFTSLSDFSSGSGVHGRAAYLLSSATGSFQASWTLSVASGGSGSAILALKAA